VPLTATDADTGVTLIEVRVGLELVTVSCAVPLIVCPVAVTLAVIVTGLPAATPVANPHELLVLGVAVQLLPLTMVADRLEEAHTAELVRFCVLLSEYVPVAVNCWVPLTATDAIAGVTLIEVRVLLATVSMAIADTV